MRKKLTEREVEKLRSQPEHATAHDFFDHFVHGLCLTVRPTGAASWCLRYRYGGQQRRLTLGRSPALSLEAARKAARHHLQAVAVGRDPAADKRALRRAPPSDDLFPTMVRRFIVGYAEPRNRNWREAARALGLRVSGARGKVEKPLNLQPIADSLAERWASMRVSDLTRADVAAAVQQLVAAEKLPSANARLAHLKSLFSWLRDQGHIDRHPCEAMRPPARVVSRDRVLTDRELGLLWRASGRLRSPFREFVRILLVTGQRRNEVAAMRSAEINGAIWKLPAARAKNGNEHVVPLPDAAIIELLSLPFRGPRVFTTASDGRTSLGCFSKIKAALMTEVLSIDPAGIEPWTFHDLRRTAASGMARLGVEPWVIETCLNHKSGTIKGVAKTYNRYKYEREVGQALQLWSAHVVKIGAEPTERLPVAAKTV